MNAVRRKCAVVMLVMVAGCIPMSLNPIYTDDVLVQDSRLEGAFAEGETTWTFESAEERAYTLTVAEGEEVWKYTAHLVQLKEDYFLDLLVEEAPGFPDDTASMLLVPAHTFFRVEFTNTGLKFHMLNMDWLAERADRGRLWISHVRVDQYDGYPVFTASPQRMQRFLRRWAHDPEAWSDESEVARVQASAGAS